MWWVSILCGLCLAPSVRSDTDCCQYEWFQRRRPRLDVLWTDTATLARQRDRITVVRLNQYALAGFGGFVRRISCWWLLEPLTWQFVPVVIYQLQKRGEFVPIGALANFISFPIPRDDP